MADTLRFLCLLPHCFVSEGAAHLPHLKARVFPSSRQVVSARAELGDPDRVGVRLYLLHGVQVQVALRLGRRVNDGLVVHEEMLLLHLREADLVPLAVCSSLEGLIRVAGAAALAAIACIVLICHQSLHFVKHIILLIIATTTQITQVESIQLRLLEVEGGFIERVVFVLLVGWPEWWEQVVTTTAVGGAYCAPTRTRVDRPLQCTSPRAFYAASIILLASEFFQPAKPLVEFIGIIILLYQLSRVIRALAKLI